MSLVTLGTTLVVLMLLASVMLGWVAELKRAGGSVSAQEFRARAERGQGSFYTSREARADAMRERIQRERRRRERARAAFRAAAEPGPRAAPHADRPAAPPPDAPEVRHRATLELPPGRVTQATLRRHYLRLVAAYHPDRVAGLGAKLQRLAEEETKAINEAYAYFRRRLGE